MAKKRATKAAIETTNALTRLKKNPNSAKTLGQLPDAKSFHESLAAAIEEQRHNYVASAQAAIENQRNSVYASVNAAMEEQRHRYEVEIPDWLESLGMERDLALATQIALVEYREFLTRDEIDDCETTTLIELIKTVAAKKEWERKIAARNEMKPVWSTGRSPSDWLKVFAKLNVACRNLNLFRKLRDDGTYHEHPDTIRTSKSVRLAIADLPPAYSDEMNG